MAHFTSVHFRCQGNLDFGRRLAVVGDHPSLGNWDINACHELQRISTVDDVWTSRTPASLPLKERREYRYVVLNDLGGFVQWHEDSIRHVEPTGQNMIVEDDYGYYREQYTAKSDAGVPPLHPIGPENAPSGTDSLCAIQKLHGLDVDPNATVYFVSSRLPIQVYRGADGVFAIRESNTPLTTTLWKIRKRCRNKMRFVGSCLIETDCDSSSNDVSGESSGGNFSESEKDELRILLLEHDCIPVFIPIDILSGALRFCKEHLWNLFYNIGLWNVDEQREFSWELWNAYVGMNQHYADLAATHGSEDDFFWVHDYKLLMVPHFITRRMKRANIGVFMHAMFPSSNLFLCSAVREAILRSMLCADLIGFQFFDYARHFLTCCKRLLGLDHSSRVGGMLGIEYNGRDVMILLSHSHIQPDLLEFMLDEQSVQELVSSFRAEWQDRFVIASVDRDIRLAGLFLKFKAFRKYLESYPVSRGKVLLVQYVCATDTLWECRREEVVKLLAIVDEINSAYGITHVVLEFNVCPERRFVLFAVADCLLDTSIRGGINMRALEYIYCRRGRSGSVILSEFVGFSKMLLSAIRVNPWHIESVVEALDRAMCYSSEERAEVALHDFEYVMSSDTVAWVDHFVREMHFARKRPDMLHLTWGFGNNYKTYSVPSTFQLLDKDLVLQRYHSSVRRLIMIDCEGTMCPSLWDIPPRSPQDCEQRIRFHLSPMESNVDNIRILSSNPLNIVVAISGRNRDCLETWFPDLPNLGLCAGYGYFYKIPFLTGGKWNCMVENVDDRWKVIALQIMEQYAHRTPGSYIENMDVMVVFQYHHSDPEFSATQSVELLTVLKQVMAPYPVDVQRTKWNVHVCLRGVNKGATLLNIAENYCRIYGDFDFILCVGDHRSDEEMFKALETLEHRVHGAATNIENARRNSGYISVTVGMKPTKAMYYVNDYTEVTDLLSALATFDNNV
ncbi:Glycosyltransferase 20 family protein [Babesia bovis T2Bo]|uniref:Trehalose-6-phosphate synthase domain containing protein, putative n=1 Tax=Babesia bovis TaxID=5865 RepID=A7AST1_BABBO|nr:Glycosyltransferase 20 family protein [Babesia bovis T2Bo]EDO05992.1 Glycosyltransferase 20 family protein [Babesia bovis T2Bo]|eukprot:XP_001609560.1 trehalose-6-phosphate synthase domain containing protein [Babesia bovis T2Bo]